MKKQEETKQKSLVAKQAEYKALQAQAETVSISLCAITFIVCLFCNIGEESYALKCLNDLSANVELGS